MWVCISLKMASCTCRKAQENIEANLSLYLSTNIDMATVKLQAYMIHLVWFRVLVQRTDAITKEGLSADNSVLLRRSNTKLLAFQGFSCCTRGFTKPYCRRSTSMSKEKDV